MKNDTVLKGGLVVDPVNHVRKMQDVAIRDGKIVELGENLSGERVYDVSGKAVLPGVIDMHVHVTETLGGLVGYHMAAASGVTTIIDYAGPIDDIAAHVVPLGCGMNVGCLPSALPSVLGTDPSRKQVGEFLSSVLKQGALGLKILGGHYPLTPNASRFCIEECNARKALVAWHAGSTENRSDIYGMKEAVEYAKGYRLLLAHINAYCRGNRYNYLEELRDAFQMLRDNPNIISDSHMAVDNGTSGACANGAPCDNITRNCLRNFGYPDWFADDLLCISRPGYDRCYGYCAFQRYGISVQARLDHHRYSTCDLSHFLSIVRLKAITSRIRFQANARCHKKGEILCVICSLAAGMLLSPALCSAAIMTICSDTMRR